MKNMTLLFILILICTDIFALNIKSPAGRWITTDATTQKQTGIVEMTDHDGSLYGKIVAGSDIDPIKYCHNCPGTLKNSPVIGLTFLRGFIPHENNIWTNGSILDPHTGKTYRGTIILIDNGNKLQLRGYWGIFFQTQTWVRESTHNA